MSYLVITKAKSIISSFFKTYYFDRSHKYKLIDFIKFFVTNLSFFLFSFLVFYFLGISGHLGFFLKVFYIVYLLFISSIVAAQFGILRFPLRNVIFNLLDLLFTVFVVSFFGGLYHILDFGTMMNPDYFYNMIR